MAHVLLHVLAPVDSVGNQLMQVRLSSEFNPCGDRLTNGGTINQHLVPLPPPEPEPPLGVEWLGTLTDYMEVDEFKTTGAVALITLVMSMISLPILFKKRKRLARVMNARNRRSSARETADEFEDFFD